LRGARGVLVKFGSRFFFARPGSKARLEVANLNVLAIHPAVTDATMPNRNVLSMLATVARAKLKLKLASRIKLARGKSSTRDDPPSRGVVSMANNAANIYSPSLSACYPAVEFYCQTVTFTFTSFQICGEPTPHIPRVDTRSTFATASRHECGNAVKI